MIFQFDISAIQLCMWFP